jgi:hypothetical protein
VLGVQVGVPLILKRCSESDQAAARSVSRARANTPVAAQAQALSDAIDQPKVGGSPPDQGAPPVGLRRLFRVKSRHRLRSRIKERRRLKMVECCGSSPGRRDASGQHAVAGGGAGVRRGRSEGGSFPGH